MTNDDSGRATPTDARSRFLGCILGGAIGDALGAPIEFESLSAIRRRFGPGGLAGFVPAYGRPGSITDDTQMTLFTAEGLLRSQRRRLDGRAGDEAEVIWDAYQRWLATQSGSGSFDQASRQVHDGWLITNDFLHQRRAPGNTCLAGLRSERGGSPQHPLNHSKGCGGVMRVAPIGLVSSDPFGLAVEAAALTHGHPTGHLAAGAFAAIIGHVTKGDSLDSSTSRAMDELVRWDAHEESLEALDKALAQVGSGDPSPERVEKLGGGWVAEEALAIAVYCALSARDSHSALLLAVNHSGDSDSTGSMTGNLVGALGGREVLPSDLVRDVEGREAIEALAADLADTFIDGKPPDPHRYPSS